MYKVYAKWYETQGNTVVTKQQIMYNDRNPSSKTVALIDPDLSLSSNAAGTFNATLPNTNYMYDQIEPITHFIDVYKDDAWYWSGRVLTVSRDFYLNKAITCEGALSFLNDTIVKLQKFSGASPANVIGQVLGWHNNKVDTFRRIYPGAISSRTASGRPINSKDYYSEDDTSLKILTDLADEWGFVMRIRPHNGILLLDMLSTANDVLNTASQKVNFGKNLMDYSSEQDWSDIVTVLMPIGAKLDTNKSTGDEDHPDRVTLSTIPNGIVEEDPDTHIVVVDEDNSYTGTLDAQASSNDPVYRVDGDYLINVNAMNKYGRIEQTVEWSEVDDPGTLLTLAKYYMSDYSYENMSLEVTLMDLHYLKSGIQSIELLDKVRCISKPHSLDEMFIVLEMDIPLNTPENTSITLKRDYSNKYSSSNGSVGGAGKISASASEIRKPNYLLNEARQNAFSMIDMATNGYVTMVPVKIGNRNSDRTAAIMIADAIDPEQATHRWVWNVKGMYHQHREHITDPWIGSNLDCAITMEGKIVANWITAGVFKVPDNSPIVIDSDGAGYLFTADMDRSMVTLGPFTVTGSEMYLFKRRPDLITSSGIYLGYDGFSVQPGSISNHLEFRVSNNAIATYYCDKKSDGSYVSNRTFLFNHSSNMDVLLGFAHDLDIDINRSLLVTIPEALHIRTSNQSSLYTGVNQTYSVDIGGIEYELEFTRGICTTFSKGIEPEEGSRPLTRSVATVNRSGKTVTLKFTKGLLTEVTTDDSSTSPWSNNSGGSGSGGSSDTPPIEIIDG